MSWAINKLSFLYNLSPLEIELRIMLMVGTVSRAQFPWANNALDDDDDTIGTAARIASTDVFICED